MIRLTCPRCNQRLKAPDKAKGKRVRCPKCDNLFQVPWGSDGSEPIEYPMPTGELRLRDPPAKESEHQQIPPWEVPPEENPQDSNTPTTARTYPWLIDILLYPANLPGLINIGILWVLLAVLGLSRMVRMTIVPGQLLLYLVPIIWMAFLAYYLAECVRDSASGNTRAVDTIGSPPGLWDALEQIALVLAVLLVVGSPAGLYGLLRSTSDWAFWTLAGLGVFCLPMVLLSAILFNSGSGLNPAYWIPAIARTMTVYLGVVLVTGAGSALAMWAFWMLSHCGLGILGPPVLIYVLMILAHLLGRFYFRYHKKIGWDI